MVEMTDRWVLGWCSFPGDYPAGQGVKRGDTRGLQVEGEKSAAEWKRGKRGSGGMGKKWNGWFVGRSGVCVCRTCLSLHAHQVHTYIGTYLPYFLSWSPE